MSGEYIIGVSSQPVNGKAVNGPYVPSLSQKKRLSHVLSGCIVAELAQRLGLPTSWIRSHTKGATHAEVPHVRFGRYVRFRWVAAW